MLEKGRNHLLALDAAVRRARPRLATTRSSSSVATSSAPTRSSSRAPTGATTPTATACSRARSTTCRRPSAAAASTPTASSRAFAPSTSSRAAELGPIEGADIVDWPIDYDEMEPYYAEAERLIGVAGRRRREPVRGVAQRPVPDAARRRHVRRGAHHRGRDAARLPPVPRADRCELGAVRRPARVQQLRVLRPLRLPDRGEGRSDRAAAQRAAHRPLRDPARVDRRARAARRERAHARAACGTSTPTATRTR